MNHFDSISKNTNIIESALIHSNLLISTLNFEFLQFFL